MTRSQARVAAGAFPRGHESLDVAVYSGIYVRHDAMSNSVRHKVDILTRLREQGFPVTVSVLTRHTDQPGVTPVPSVAALLRRSEFVNAGIHIFEFGISYDLFDGVFLVPPGRAIMGVYHSVTPHGLVDTPATRDAVRRSRVQRHNLELADHVLCVSEFNRDELIAMGMDAGRLSVLHLPPAHPMPERSRDALGTGDPVDPVRLIFAGRMVRAKGVRDLLEAVRSLRARSVDGFTITFAGNLVHSEAGIVDEIRQCAAEFPGAVTVVADPSDDELARLYAAADALVMPSYHEGYCVPVIEAYFAGCYVIASDAGNLPNVVHGLGTLVPTGDVTRLAGAIETFVTRLRSARRDATPLILDTAGGEIREDAWRIALTSYLAGNTIEAYERGFLCALEQVAGVLPAGAPRWLTEHVAERVREAACA